MKSDHMIYQPDHHERFVYIKQTNKQILFITYFNCTIILDNRTSPNWVGQLIQGVLVGGEEVLEV